MPVWVYALLGNKAITRMLIKCLLRTSFVVASLSLSSCKIGELLNPPPSYSVAPRFVSRAALVIPSAEETPYLPPPQLNELPAPMLSQFRDKSQLLEEPDFMLEYRKHLLHDFPIPSIELKS